MTRRLDFRLLGPLEVHEGARSLPLGGRKQRSLLALLLLHANEVVATDTLIDSLWGERAPKTASTALQVYVSNLRKLLSAERVETRSPGYVLRVEPDELDLARFERLCREARAAKPAAAAAVLAEALALWHGRPLADFAYDSFAQAEIARLEELRLSALEQRIEAELELGRHADLIGELESLVGEHPLRERLRAQLILALYRSGRQAEALEAYRQARETLVEELGIEPGAALKELERAILAQDEALEAQAPRAMPELPTGTVTLLFTDIEGSTRLLEELGRERYMEALDAHRRLLREACAGHGGVEVEMQGDSFHFAFPSARAAADAAAAAQRAHAVHAWQGEPLRVRIGLHTGEPVAHGELFAGLDVHRAARIMGAAEGGQVLVSQTTRQLLAGELELRDLGERRLKDIKEPERIYALLVEDGEPVERAEPVREERKRVSVLFAELTGLYARAGSTDPEDVRAAIAPYEARVAEEIERFGGTVERFVGETVMAVFGAAVVHEDDAERAVRAALALPEVFASEPELTVRAAVATGEAVVSVGEGPSKVVGEVVNAAARLKDGAPPGGVVVSPSTQRATKEIIEYEQTESEIDSWRAIRARPQAEPSEPGTPFVGRKDELALLEQTFTRTARETSVQLVTVTGEPGVGKSRLVRELRVSLERQRRPFLWLEGRCLPYGEGITFWALGEIVKAHAGILESDDPERAAGKLATTVEAAVAESSERSWLQAKLAPLVGASVEEASAGGERSESFTAWRRFLEALAEERPLVLVFEDLHWADPALLEFVEHLLDWATESPLLVVCTARPELYDAQSDWGGGKRNAAAVALAPLSPEETNRLVETLLAELDLPPATQDRLLEGSGGNPLYAEQFARLVQEGGLLEGDTGTEIPVPETIHALIEARLDTLSGDRRELLENAAVVGRVFWTGAVAAMNGLDEPAIAGLCQELAHRELVRRGRVSSVEGEAEYSFWHELVRDVAYGRIPRSARADKHLAAAAWIEALAGDSVGIDEILGYHLEQAHRYRAEASPDDKETQQLGARAAQVLAGAGRRALLRRDESAAVNLLGRAVSILPKEDPIRGELLPDLGSALMRTGDFRHAEGVLTEASEAAAATGDRRLELRALIELEFCQSYLNPDGWIEDRAGVSDEAIPELEELGDELGLAKAWWLKSDVYAYSCRWGARAEALERAVEHARRAGDAREEGTLVGLLAQALYWGPTPVPEAIRRCKELLPEADQDRSLEAGISSALAGLHAMRGDSAEAQRLWARARLIHDELGQNHRRAVRSLIGAAIERLAGHPDEAAETLRWGHNTLESMGETSARATVAAALAQTLYVLSRYEEAERFTGIAEQIEAKDDRATQVMWRGIRAKLLARRGELERAKRLAREAVELAEETDFPELQAGALLDLAEVLGLAGSAHDAGPLLEQAKEIYVRKGNVIAARKVAELGAEPARSS